MTLEAGPELDARIAREVMGWTERGSRWIYPGGRYKWRVDWNPSSNIAAAWEVVEKMKPLSFDCGTPHRRGAGVVDEWWARFGPNATVPSHAPTAPLAICRAALAATH